MRVWTLALLPVALAMSAMGLAIRSEPITPKGDPFYEPPSNWEDKPLGHIYRSREVNVTAILEFNIAKAYQLLYRTSYANKSEPTTSVTTIIIPHNAQKDKLVAYGDWEDANGPQCAPSYVLQKGLFGPDPSVVLNYALMLPFLQAGYPVAIPDKEGRKSVFASGFVEGHQTLDAIRAVVKFDKMNFTKDVRVVGTGYSGGAIQMGWAASLMPVYAPEIPVVGWYYGGTPTSISALARKLNKSIFSGFLIAGITSLVDTYPEIKEFIHKVGTAELLNGMQFVREHCVSDNNGHFTFADLKSKKYTTLGDKFFEAAPVKKVFKLLQMGRDPDLTPNVPVLMQHGVSDEISDYDAAVDSYVDWCKHGANIELTEYVNPLAAHALTAITGVPSSFLWLKDRLDGKEVSVKGCKSTKTEDLLLDTNDLGEEFKDVLGIIKGLAGSRIGPKDREFKKGMTGGN
ncbi:hypothetical protein MCAP1_002097 [Malassezia caprae]|uniref:triacylglycerol lipase n=1 Tax=Malassezia caprae TaxID=1381934 RepID=A0AAF0E5B4_9BASI|nr:hypothetical protein MCAP1_002097 [Malassezia caprae]